MKKEMLIRIVIDDNKIGSIIQKSGFTDDINSTFEFIGILNKVIHDEQTKLDDKLKVEQKYLIKEPHDGNDA